MGTVTLVYITYRKQCFSIQNFPLFQQCNKEGEHACVRQCEEGGGCGGTDMLANTE